MIMARCMVLVGCLTTLLFLILPVYANPMQPTMTKVFITQNGIPVDDTVDFSLDCFGKAIDLPGGSFDLSRYGIEKAQNLTGDNDAVYTYAATCKPAENCIVYKPDMPWLLRISYCDLSGTYKGRPFLLKNFSRNSMESSLEKILVFGDKRETYALTQEAWTSCYDQRNKNERACDKFMIKGAQDIVNESGVYRTDLGPDYWRCGDNAT